MPLRLELEVEAGNRAFQDCARTNACREIGDHPFFFAQLLTNLAVALDLLQREHPLGCQEVDTDKEPLHVEAKIAKVEVRGL